MANKLQELWLFLKVKPNREYALGITHASRLAQLGSTTTFA